jgi:D-threo-aldose 1-dehydrogenase
VTLQAPPQFVNLGVAGLNVSRIGFGTSKLFRLHTSRERQRVLDAAFDAGIRHFDTARMYGLGMAEAELGRFLARHRGAVTVATKFGIPVSTTGSLLRPIQGLVRRVVGGIPGLQRRLRARPSPLMAARCFDLEAARTSLETSLRMLGVETIDILFLHEPNPQSAIPAEMEAFLAEARDRGDIRAWGVSGRLSEVLPVQADRPELVQILQYASDAVSHATEPAVPPLPRITYAPFADAIDRTAALLESSAEAARAWDRELAIPRDRDSLATALLSHAIAGGAAAVFSTTRAESIAPLLNAALRPEADTLALSLRHWLAAHLPA